MSFSIFIRNLSVCREDMLVCLIALQNELLSIRQEMDKMLARRLDRVPKIYLLQDKHEAQAQCSSNSSTSVCCVL